MNTPHIHPYTYDVSHVLTMAHMGNTTVSVGFLIYDLSIFHIYILYLYYLLTICQHIDLLEGAIPYDIIFPSHNIQYSIAKLIIDMINVLFCHTVKTNVYIYIEYLHMI
jgi:hypothetical protein